MFLPRRCRHPIPIGEATSGRQGQASVASLPLAPRFGANEVQGLRPQNRRTSR